MKPFPKSLSGSRVTVMGLGQFGGGLGVTRWLVARGASVVAGAHPHVVQRSEFHGGARILHSLGNAVYPKALKGADSGKVEVVEVQRIREIR